MKKTLKSQSGYAILTMTFVASMVIALMIFSANESNKTTALARAMVKEQVGAMDLMKDIGLLIRRSYDVWLASGGGGCNTALYRDQQIATAGSGGAIRLCIPRGAESCFQHPLDPNPLAGGTRPQICLDQPFNANNRQIYLSFKLDPSQSKQYWAQKYKEWGIEDESQLTKRLQAFSSQLQLLPEAHAQNDINKEWFPAPGVITGAGQTYQVQAVPATVWATRTCSSADTICVSYAVCLRLAGCQGGANRVNEEFVQTVGLDR